MMTTLVPRKSTSSAGVHGRLSAWSSLLLACVLALGISCGGGGGSSPTQARIFAFTPEAAPSTASVFLAMDPASTEDLLILELRAFEVEDLSGVAFDLAVPSNILRFRRFSGGDFLTGGVEYRAQGFGLITGSAIAIARPDGTRPGFDGSGVLMRMEFDATGNGSGSLDFPLAVATDSTIADLGLPFLAGTVTIQR